jgi:hypothetical protein
MDSLIPIMVGVNGVVGPLEPLHTVGGLEVWGAPDLQKTKIWVLLDWTPILLTDGSILDPWY